MTVGGEEERAAGAEWALFLPLAQDPEPWLPREGGPIPPADPWTVSPGEGLTAWGYRGVIEASGGCSGWRRLYWGNEFCETLIPTAGEARRLAGLARERGLPWTLVTPYLSDEGLDRMQRLLEELPEDCLPAEAVVNDWGLLRWLRREFPPVSPVLGRLMNKMIRDPRVAPHYDRPGAPPEAMRALRGFSLLAADYGSFLEEAGVGRVEVDNPPQGLEVDFRELGFRGSLYLPFGFVTSGRLCLPGSLDRPREHKFSLLGTCGRECRRVALELRNTRSPYAGERGLTLYQRGNTVFYLQTPEAVGRALEESLGHGVDRVVWQPAMPF